jgi:hypothetical protein
MKTHHIAIAAFLMLGFFASAQDCKPKEKKHFAFAKMFKGKKHRKPCQCGPKVKVAYMVNEGGQVTEANAINAEGEAKIAIEERVMQMSFPGAEMGVKHYMEMNPPRQ